MWVLAGTSLHAQVCYQFSGVPAPNAPVAFSTFVVQVKIANPSLLSIGGIIEGGFTSPDSFSVTVDQITQKFDQFQVAIINNPSALSSTTTFTISGATLGSSFAQILLSGDGNLLASGLPQSLPPLSAWNGDNSFGFTISSKLYQGTITSIAACGAPITPGSPPPTVASGGIVPVFSTSGTIESGEWISIYGTSLAGSTATWNGDFPTTLGTTSVTLDGKPAYLWLVSPTQINLQVPDDSGTGTVPVVVTTPNGTASATVTLAQFAPSFSLLDAHHVTGIISRTDGSGAYGGGTYDILGPTGSSLGYATVAAKSGDAVTLFAVGLGPTNPHVPSGQPFSGSAPTTNPVTVRINNVAVTPSYAGETSAGLYQLNLTIPPSLGTGDVPLQAAVGGVQTQPNVVISLGAATSSVQLKSVGFSILGNLVGSQSSAVGTVVLSGPAAAGGALISLSSSTPSAVSVPSSLLVPAGAVSATFTATTGLVLGSQPFTITAAYNGQSVVTSLTVTSATASSPFTEIIVIPTFQPAGYPAITTASFTVTPDAGNATYTACIDGCQSGAVLLNGTTSDQGKTFTFNTLQAGRSNNILFAGSSTGLLQLSSISLTFSTSQFNAISAGSANGTITGTLTATGTPYLASGAAITLSGPLSGNYSVIKN